MAKMNVTRKSWLARCVDGWMDVVEVGSTKSTDKVGRQAIKLIINC